ncbi:UDP-N-acetylmuramyl-tripeptide synthetase MurE [Legionella moravica]|uniref:UDP-N-acetylmuramoyl-L-alanyl-D-glutamate--2,6-diaminopimelate ligase n=1 Tax=Legionella moravica TaxID=39962 RepID=A0A378JX23_9GAMM|nr:UDP-N-acetylmuramoyl-L-alanyl-D-glutamate--2,6-diaminopimelate ligase [Legionella moravica]KTD34273.1 UDP-N-acetylmuramyl-tripeptide synthetase MurE [Legionella moravica]STX63265.1 UDP-N-acetylmuramyl-tripeptide synthetase MurE [Legionella moravica]
MELNQLLKPWMQQEISNCELNDIKNDSRLIQKGDLFIAYPGAASDGRLYIDKAVQSGAVAVVYDPDNLPATFKLPVSVPCVPVPHLAAQLAPIAKRFYQEPGKSLTVTGVTGTNGKTTIAYQLAQAHELLGQKSAYIGTIGQGTVHELKPLDNTTPDALCLQKLLFQYQQQGIKQVSMEVSSHALSQHRVDSIDFNQALFTNLTLDHLDYHHTMQAYGEAKAMLFAREELQWAIINQDDEYQHLMSRSIMPHVKKITYGMGSSCDVKAVKWHSDLNGTAIEVHSPWGMHELNINALGQFNIYNSLAVFSSLMASGYAAGNVAQVMSRLNAAPGRMEIVANSPYVLVDYAHTPDALENVLTTLNQLKKGRLWVIFGCGGDRDKSKRPVMGKAASRYADKIVITSDNPRSEDPSVIIEEVAQGIPSSASVIKLINREEAIAHALQGAEKDDIILIAGKGHEAYQQIGSEKRVFSDQEVVRRLIKE